MLPQRPTAQPALETRAGAGSTQSVPAPRLQPSSPRVSHAGTLPFQHSPSARPPNPPSRRGLERALPRAFMSLAPRPRPEGVPCKYPPTNTLPALDHSTRPWDGGWSGPCPGRSWPLLPALVPEGVPCKYPVLPTLSQRSITQPALETRARAGSPPPPPSRGREPNQPHTSPCLPSPCLLVPPSPLVPTT
jgi:hypothetical protein